MQGKLERDRPGAVLSDLGLARLDDLSPPSPTARSRRGPWLPASHPTRLERPESRPEPKPEARRPRPAAAGGDGIEVRGHGDMLVTLAKCCAPIRGDGSPATSRGAGAWPSMPWTVRTSELPL